MNYLEWTGIGTSRLSEEDLFYCLRLDGETAVKRIKEELHRGNNLDCQYKGWTFLTAVCSLGRCDILEVVLDHEREVQVAHLTRCKLPSCFSCSRLPRKHFILDSYDDNGDTPLISAIRSGHTDICHLLIESGANINLPNQISHQTPLVVAIECSQDAIVLYLLETHADVQVTDNVGITPLYAAIKAKKYSIVNDLIRCGCDVNIGSQDHAPIFLATRMGDIDLVQCLHEAGCVMDIANKYGVTPVYEAALKGHSEILQFLLRVNCDPNKVDMYGQSPLHVAILSGSLKITKLLIQGGANLKLRNQQYQTPLCLAMMAGRANILHYFMLQGINVFPKARSIYDDMDMEQPPSGCSSLSTMAEVFKNGHSSVLEVLIQGCTRLPIPDGLTVHSFFRNVNNGHLLQLLLLSGIQPVPHFLLDASPHPHPCKETSDWLTDFTHNALSLKASCRISIRRCLGNKVFFKASRLPLPTELKNYVTMQYL